MAVRAILMRNFLFEIPSQVALAATHAGMFAEQRKVGLGVIKSRGGLRLMPTAGIVAGLACVGKRAAMRIGVARAAFLESEPNVFDKLCRLGCRRIAFYARSEEHTSELQSRLQLVCRLLLEKKKTTDSTSERPRW